MNHVALDLLHNGLAVGDPRAETLAAAAECVLKNRAQAYGSPEDNFARIADLWNVHLENRRPGPLVAADVAILMVLMKVARLQETPGHMDSWIDTAGYAACGARCVAVPQEPSPGAVGV